MKHVFFKQTTRSCALCSPFIGSFIEVDTVISNEDEFSTECDERLGDKTALSEMEEDGRDIVTQNLLNESDEVQLADSQNAEKEDNSKDAENELQDISLVTLILVLS